MASDSPHTRDWQSALEWIAHLEQDNAILREALHAALDVANELTEKRNKRDGRLAELTAHIAKNALELQALRAEQRKRANQA